MQSPKWGSSAELPWTAQLEERRSRGGETLLAQKSVTDKSEKENYLFCHTVRGSDHRFCLFFIDKHESRFKIASHHTTLIASKARAQIPFSWAPFTLKKRKAEPNPGSTPHPSGSSSTRTPFSSCLPRSNGSHAEISRLRRSSVGTNKALTLIINCTLLFLSTASPWSSRVPSGTASPEPRCAEPQNLPGCNSGTWRRRSPPKFGVSVSSNGWQPKKNQLFTWQPEKSLCDYRHWKEVSMLRRNMNKIHDFVFLFFGFCFVFFFQKSDSS